MTLFMGPVLRLQNRKNSEWHISVLVVSDEGNPTLTFSARDEHTFAEADPDTPETPVEPVHLLEQHRGSKSPRYVLRYDIRLELKPNAEQEVTYGIGNGETWTFRIPEQNAGSLRLAATSCNGFSSNRERREMVDPYNRWKDLVAENDEQPFHMLVMAGDQVYADSIWDECKPIAQWAEREDEGKWRASFTKRMESEVDRFYFNLYCRSWGPPGQRGRSTAMREALASIPTLMMWDDHDIFDGWGSYNDNKLMSPVYNGIYQTARRYFQVFQQHRKPGGDNVESNGEESPSEISPSTSNLSYGVTLGNIGVLVLDLRSERTRDQLMSDQAWEDIQQWLVDQEGSTLRHLFVVSSVPVVHIDMSAMESVTQYVDPMDLDDDLRDHWLSPAHKQKRRELIQELFRFADASGTRVTLLSGDIHVGALGLLEKQADSETGAAAGSIYQVISSPMTHPTPASVMNWFYDWRASATEEVDRTIASRFVQLPGGLGEYYVSARHWVSLSYLERNGRVRLEWRPETEDGTTPTPYLHTIDAPGGVNGHLF